MLSAQVLDELPLGVLPLLDVVRGPEANMYILGWLTTARTDFLWLVSVHMDLPAARSHMRMVLSLLPVTICGSVDWQATVPTVEVCPVSVCTFTLVRMSQTRAVES